ncbi:MAG: 5'-methylthioadenosine/S-adenosylhomocysteine nucleosidase [Chloroflexi bacterium]|nr:5'-methylthioadenosine/S-adenosylhomocysteine nucleosidase [Chloroflexota bacterium]
MNLQIAVLISSDVEWSSVIKYHKNPELQTSPFGAFFFSPIAGILTLFFQGGWGKISASASTQYVIDRWKPKLIINIGTCGGIKDRVCVGEVLLVEKTIVYDIVERMGDPLQAIAHYSTTLDLSYLSEPYPQKVRKSFMLTADQDLDPARIFELMCEYPIIAADWESGAIAWVAQKNQVPCLILRAVSDLVDEKEGEAYNNRLFKDRAEEVTRSLLYVLPVWIKCIRWNPNQ